MRVNTKIPILSFIYKIFTICWSAHKKEDFRFFWGDLQTGLKAIVFKPVFIIVTLSVSEKLTVSHEYSQSASQSVLPRLPAKIHCIC
jgi:hypothetical protein